MADRSLTLLLAPAEHGFHCEEHHGDRRIESDDLERFLVGTIDAFLLPWPKKSDHGQFQPGFA